VRYLVGQYFRSTPAKSSENDSKKDVDYLEFPGDSHIDQVSVAFALFLSINTCFLHLLNQSLTLASLFFFAPLQALIDQIEEYKWSPAEVKQKCKESSDAKETLLALIHKFPTQH
jgi:hypothetical protein